MKVKIITIGRFWHFHLARQLHKFKLLDEIYSGYPKFKLRNEYGIPTNKIKTYPYYQVPSLFFIKYLQKFSPKINHYLSDLAQKTLANKVAKNIGEANIIIGNSRSGLEAGIKIKKLGGKYICDRGATHILEQKEIIKEGYKELNMTFNEMSDETIDREINEYDEANIISVPSTFALNSFLKKGFDRKKLFVNSLGVDLRRFKPLPRIKSDKFKVLYVGNLSVRKGIVYLLEAFKKLNFKNKELILIGPIEKNIKKKVEKYFSENIKYLSTIKNSQLNMYYSNADVTVQPSLEDGFNLVIAEALACGCPVITTENTGGPDLFNNGNEGFIIKPMSAEKIYEKLEQLADDRSLRKRMSANAVLTTKKIGGWNEYGERWISKLNNLNYE